MAPLSTWTSAALAATPSRTAFITSSQVRRPATNWRSRDSVTRADDSAAATVLAMRVRDDLFSTMSSPTASCTSRRAAATRYSLAWRRAAAASASASEDNPPFDSIFTARPSWLPANRS
jgi:hypothetical protein